MANAIGTDWRISRVFPWPITSETDLQGRKFISGVNFRVFPSHFGDLGCLWRENSAASERCSKIAQRSNQPSSRKCLQRASDREYATASYKTSPASKSRGQKHSTALKETL